MQLYRTADNKAGKNPYFSVLKDGKIDVKTPKQEESESLPLKTFFPAQKYISMIKVLATVNEERKAQLLDAIEKGSVMTWAHFNLHGEFDFQMKKCRILLG